MSEVLQRFSIRAFRAVDEPELCEEYIKGHVKVLTDFGIANITSNNNEWTKHPHIYCLGLRSEAGELLSGIRIQLADGNFPLPIEIAIGKMDNKIYTLVDEYAKNGGIGELSGLWVDNRLRGLSIGWYMVRAAIASSIQLNFKTMIGICGNVTLKMFNSVGFVVEEELGNNGQFLYPNDELIAHAVGILDAISLEHAFEYDKNIMQQLRSKYIQKRIEKDSKTHIQVDYNLVYPNVIPLNYKKTK